MANNTSANFGLRTYLKQRESTRKQFEAIVKSRAGNRTFDFFKQESQNLLINTEIMSSLVRNTTSSIELGLIDDYSFLVFPAAKAYEGFLKQLSAKVGFTFSRKKAFQLITRELLEKNPDFGIGVIFNETANPGIIKILRDTIRFKNHPNFMKAIWDKCRCDILHYDYKKLVKVSLQQSSEQIGYIYQAINWGFEAYIDEPNYTVEEILKSFNLPKPLPLLK